MKRPLLLFLIFFLCLHSLITQGQMTNIDSLEQLLKKDLSDTGKVDVLNELAYNYIHKNPGVASDDVNLAMGKAKKINYLKGEARSLNVLGGINWAQGNYPLALDYYVTAAKSYESLGDRLSLAKCYNNIGEIYKKINEPDNASIYLAKALAIFEEEFDGDKAVLLIYINIGELYLTQDSLEKAKMYYQQVIDKKEIADDKKMAYAYIGLGRIATKNEAYKKAEAYYRDALTLRQRQQDNRGTADAYIRIGQLLDEQKLYDSAERYFDKALEITKEINAKDLTMKSYMGKVIADSSRNDYSSSLQNYLLYSAVKDSTFNKDKSDQIARLQTAYETQMLSKENEANQIKVRQQNIIVICVVMALILCIAVAGGLYKQRKVQQAANKLLGLKNAEINERNQEIERQSDELTQLNNKLKNLNEGLEEQVKIRTRLLSEQNEILSHYAFINAHELRAPVANILGLVHLLDKTALNEKEKEIIEHLTRSTKQLDEVIQDIREKLENSSELEDIPKYYRRS